MKFREAVEEAKDCCRFAFSVVNVENNVKQFTMLGYINQFLQKQKTDVMHRADHTMIMWIEHREYEKISEMFVSPKESETK